MTTGTYKHHNTRVPVILNFRKTSNKRTTPNKEQNKQMKHDVNAKRNI